uniref:Transmembrane protein n=1 Tax=Romanomermis culicivorax TaxID=13658 RepID=A0A915J3I6_ROMCU
MDPEALHGRMQNQILHFKNSILNFNLIFRNQILNFNNQVHNQILICNDKNKFYDHQILIFDLKIKFLLF